MALQWWNYCIIRTRYKVFRGCRRITIRCGTFSDGSENAFHVIFSERCEGRRQRDSREMAPRSATCDTDQCQIADIKCGRSVVVHESSDRERLWRKFRIARVPLMPRTPPLLDDNLIFPGKRGHVRGAPTSIAITRPPPTGRRSVSLFLRATCKKRFFSSEFMAVLRRGNCGR